jgi:hypothetical protein
MGNIIGAILLIILGLWVIAATAHILLDILGVVLIIAAVVLVVQHVKGTSGRSRL